MFPAGKSIKDSKISYTKWVWINSAEVLVFNSSLRHFYELNLHSRIIENISIQRRNIKIRAVLQNLFPPTIDLQMICISKLQRIPMLLSSFHNCNKAIFSLITSSATFLCGLFESLTNWSYVNFDFYGLKDCCTYIFFPPKLCYLICHLRERYLFDLQNRLIPRIFLLY